MGYNTHNITSIYSGSMAVLLTIVSCIIAMFYQEYKLKLNISFITIFDQKLLFKLGIWFVTIINKSKVVNTRGGDTLNTPTQHRLSFKFDLDIIPNYF